MPESVKDRCTKSHEYIFLLSKSPTYYFDNNAIKEPAKTASQQKDSFAAGDKFHGIVKKRNRRSVWTVSTKPFKEAHFATFPADLIRPCVLASCPAGGTVLDPFFGSGTVGQVALMHNRKFVGVELNPKYVKMAHNRLLGKTLPLQFFQ